LLLPPLLPPDVAELDANAGGNEDTLCADAASTQSLESICETVMRDIESGSSMRFTSC
jgi:hypothetical protein